LARQVGFDLCGFARIEPPPHAGFVRDWLNDGRAASMSYIANGLAKRLDPTLVLPGARSIVSVGMRYHPPPLPPIDWREQLRGRIAAYALGADYHRHVKRCLKNLAGLIAAQFPQAGIRVYVDTGPVLEREWAAAGGVGWFGKNTNILHQENGSWFFLGELITTLEIEPDPPVADHCGTCVRCLDLCPTRALEPGYALDARKCISYWTIEHRGPIPRAMRPQIDNWVFGCDVCQEVCPWNEKLARSEGSPQAEELLPSLPQLMALDESGFRARYRGSAVLRAKREGLLRNVAIVLGNSGNPRAVSPLAAALSGDPSAIVRAHAAWALGCIDDAEARAALGAAHRSEVDDSVREEVALALSQN
jgi:epoxyqueuosine reductase